MNVTGSGANKPSRHLKHADIFDQINRLKNVTETLVDLKNEIIGEQRNPQTSIDSPAPPLSVFLEIAADDIAKVNESIQYTINQIREAIF